MKITFTQYINNPLGEKSSVMTNRGMYQNMYKDKLDKILLREGGRVKYQLYKSKDKYFIYFKIPSEVINKFYYDTIIEFYTDDPLKEKSPSLKDYNVRFYSNDPAFCYTFAYAFIKNDLFIKDLESKMLKESRTTVAKEKNPKSLIGYVKSLFFAYLLIGNYGLFSKDKYDLDAESYNKNKLLKLVEHAKIKIEKRQEEEANLRRKEARKRNNEKRFSSNNTTKRSGISVTSKISSTVKRTTRVRRTKRV